MVSTLEKLTSGTLMSGVTALALLATDANAAEYKTIQGQPLIVEHSCAGRGVKATISMIINAGDETVLATTNDIQSDSRCTQAAVLLNYAKEKSYTIEVYGYFDGYVFQVEEVKVKGYNPIKF